MLVKLLNVSVVLFFGIGIASFVVFGISPEAAEEIFTIPWLSVSVRLLMFVLLIAAMTNFFRMHAKEKQVRSAHLRNGLLVSIFGVLLVDWKNGWPIISSLF
ncbi:hypothetical protein SAMN05192534_110122 [Alteribacillus persepolensis]|uniref:Uncharacterized protein n=1 Tax=Alteribacillus persepolensis TaxID=568899 RepID=A0A1G8EYH2_9BACI|nr:hypothetical protein [Alteribacillus persepolensis]SDH74948.1 hypothetical protein SAMN05192534_110122 [Alteribacillus persepolensis]